MQSYVLETSLKSRLIDKATRNLMLLEREIGIIKAAKEIKLMQVVMFENGMTVELIKGIPYIRDGIIPQGFSPEEAERIAAMVENEDGSHPKPTSLIAYYTSCRDKTEKSLRALEHFKG